MSIEAMTWAMNAKRTGPMSDGARLVLIALADYADNDGRAAFPAKRRLAERLGVTERTIKRHLSALRESGHIVYGDAQLVAHYPADRRPSVYDLALDRPRPTTPAKPVDNSPERGDRTDTPAPSGGTGLTPTGGQIVSERGDRTDPQTKNLTPPTNPTPPSPPAATTSRQHARTLKPCPVCGQHFAKTHTCRGRIAPPTPMPPNFHDLVEQARLEAQAEETATAQDPLIPDPTKERP